MTPEQVKIAKVVAAYWFISISMVYLNKILMSSDTVSINAPLFVTWYQCVITCVICYVCGVMGERLGENGKNEDYDRVESQESETRGRGESERNSTTVFFSQVSGSIQFILHSSIHSFLTKRESI